MTTTDEKTERWTVIEVYRGYAITRGRRGTFKLCVLIPLTDEETGSIETYGDELDCRKWIDVRISKIN